MSSASPNSSSGGSSRLNEFLSSIKLTTKILLAFNFSVHILLFLLSFPQGLLTISSFSVIYNFEFYRIFTAAFVHAGLLHIFMNMSSLYQLGPDIENKFGSLQFFFVTLWSVFAVGLLYVFTYWAVYMISGAVDQLFVAAVGFSGVLFTYAILEAFHTTETSRSLFGIMNVPAQAYPFILLILIQVILPGISFVGHLSGCVIGLLIICGGMQVVLPSPEFLEYIESLSWYSPITQNSSYVRCTHINMVHPAYNIWELSVCIKISETCNYGYKVMSHILEVTCKPFVIIKTMCLKCCSSQQTASSSTSSHGYTLNDASSGGDTHSTRLASQQKPPVTRNTTKGQYIQVNTRESLIPLTRGDILDDNDIQLTKV